jgi:hypothetical protein
MASFNQVDVYSKEFQNAEKFPILLLKRPLGTGPLNSTVP